MKNEFNLAFNEVLEEKQLPKEIILKALESAMVSAYRRAVNASNAQHVEAKVDIETGKVTIYAEKEIVDDVQDERTEVTLIDAQKVDPEAELGGMVVVESTPRDFGRVAAQTARQVIQQRIRDAERQSQLNHYQKQVGEIVSGVVQAVNATGMTIGLEMKAEGSMPRKEMIPGERFHIHDRVRALIAEVKDNPRGPQIILSRTHRNFLRRLLENEVPEIYHGVVEIRSIAREPGERAKVAVSATQQGIDPVGACVGIRGVRIQAIVRELHDEKIDVIEWNSDTSIFIAKAISPARVSGVYLNDQNSGGKTATVVVPEDQLSLAIGRDGQNARLAAKLTGWRIDIKSLPEAATDTLYRLQKETELAELATQEAAMMHTVEDMLARKADGKALSPEEYDQMSRFVDRVERRLTSRPAEAKVDVDALEIARGQVPNSSFEISILDSGLPEHVAYILQEAGFSTVGEMAVQMKLDADVIFALNGVGPRAQQEIKALMDNLDAHAANEQEKRAAAEASAVVVEIVPAVEEVEEPAAVETAAVEEAPAEAEPAEVASESPAAAAEEVAEPASEEEEPAFDKLFELRPEIVDGAPFEEEEEESDDSSAAGKDKKKSKKKKKHTTVEYDPEKDQVIVKKKHKRGGDEWDWEL
ncbi:MAG TPA: transcription termination factor NusA [Bellilinea sp.]|jgi:N utilization substance protein A|nr:transcription termination factor NusA [Bellilinea sp.]